MLEMNGERILEEGSGIRRESLHCFRYSWPAAIELLLLILGRYRHYLLLTAPACSEAGGWPTLSGRGSSLTLTTPLRVPHPLRRAFCDAKGGQILRRPLAPRPAQDCKLRISD